VEELEREVLLAKQDDQRLADLIERNRSWILRCASETAHRYVTESDDEWSAALLAFSEAVRDFEADKGSFRGFAAVVIRRRVLDYLRFEGRRSAELSVAPESFDGTVEEPDAPALTLEVRRRVADEALAVSAEDTAARTREEIAAMQEILGGYGFSFFDLADCSPHAEKTKTACAAAVRALLSSEALLDAMRRAHALPMKELERVSGVKRKLLDRHRRYIIAAAEILSGEYPILAGYMEFIRQ